MFSGNHKSFRRSRLSMERLEDRQMMAGDIRANLTGGTLFLNEAAGSVGADQAVQVFQLANGFVRVEGLTNADGVKTKINGANAVVFASPLGPLWRPDLQVSLGGGRDFVNVHDAKLGNVNVFTGDTFGQGASDADVVRLERVRTTGAVNVNTGAGLDVVGVYFSTIGNPTGADDLNITSGFNGAPNSTDLDAVYIQSSAVFGTTRVNTGAGDDYVSVQFSNFGDAATDFVSIDAGAGADTVELGMPNRLGQITGPVNLSGSLFILGDSVDNTDLQCGNDTVKMQSVFASLDIGVSLRTGADQLEMRNVQALRTITLHGEKGDDRMTLVEVEGRENFFAFLGEGSDTLDLTFVKAKTMGLSGGAGVGVDRLEKHQMPFIPTLIQDGWEVINGVSQAAKRTIPPINHGVLTVAR